MRDGGQADIHRRVNPGTQKYHDFEVTLHRSSGGDLFPITAILETGDEPDRAPSFMTWEQRARLRKSMKLIE
jgi:hypothetical protein